MLNAAPLLQHMHLCWLRPNKLKPTGHVFGTSLTWTLDISFVSWPHGNPSNTWSIPQKLCVHRRHEEGMKVERLKLQLHAVSPTLQFLMFHPLCLLSCNSTPIPLISWLKTAWWDWDCLRKISSDAALTWEGKSTWHFVYWFICHVYVCASGWTSLCDSFIFYSLSVVCFLCYMCAFACSWALIYACLSLCVWSPQSATCGHG